MAKVSENIATKRVEFAPSEVEIHLQFDLISHSRKEAAKKKERKQR